MGDLYAVAGNFGHRRCRVAKTVEQDVGPGTGQHLGDAQADTAGGTGDECSLAFEGHAGAPTGIVH
ncbi:hypothetical protein D3C81_1862500 [compost metagenome]